MSDLRKDRLRAGKQRDYRLIQQNLRELRQQALSNHANMLAHLIEMAYLECSDILRGTRPERIDVPPAHRHTIES